MLLLGASLAAAMPCAPLFAQDVTLPTLPSGMPEPDGQTLLTIDADELIYEEQADRATARGSVQITYGPRLLNADQVVYDRKTEVMTASGNVRLREPSGELLYADYAEITGDLRQAFADQIRLLLADGSRLAAVEADRYDDQVTVLRQAVYSPCRICASDPDRPPLWQIKAAEVIHDQNSKDVIYRDARLEFFGIPTLWTPYLTHPDPTVRQRSGLLIPRLGLDKDVGAFIRVPYYFALAPDKDLTLAPHLSTNRGLQMQGEYRQRFERGELEVEAGATYAAREVEDSDNRVETDHTWRSHLFLDGEFHVSPEWRLGADIAVTSDDTYLREYDISGRDILESRLYGEWFRERSFASVQGLAFQDLRSDVQDNEPLVLPEIRIDLSGDPGAALGGTWGLTGGILGLTRRDGPETRRADVGAEWRRRFITDLGLVSDIRLGASALVWNFNNLDDQPRFDRDEAEDNATKGRIYPFAQAKASLPLSQSYSWGLHVVEPMFGLSAALPGPDPEEIPNEDSTDLELDVSNLFDVSRFPGLDRLESGVRFSYGLGTQAYLDNGGSISAVLGQSIRLTGEDEEVPEGSGLEDAFSDPVGSLQVAPASWLDLDYRFRLDVEDLSAERQELAASVGTDRIRLTGTYVYGSEIEGSGLEAQSQIAGQLAVRFDEYWSASLRHRQDLGSDPDPLSTSLALRYADECFDLVVTAERDYNRRAGLDRGDSIYFRLALKTLGSL